MGARDEVLEVVEVDAYELEAYETILLGQLC
jgi:hypothetical protein